VFYMETVYLEMAASQERIKEELRKQAERDRTEAGLVRARSRHEDAPQKTSPHMGDFPNGPKHMERWRGAGW
jgi:hypothetical protein